MGTAKRHGTGLLAMALLAAGCGSAGDHPLVNTPGSGPIRDLVRRHGGGAAWKRHAAVRFEYRVWTAGEDAPRTLPEVAFRLDDPRHLWVRDEGESTPACLPLDAAGQYDESPVVAFAIRSIRYFFNLPLASSEGRWEFRSLLVPPWVETPDAIELVPLDPWAPVGACRLFTDRQSGLLARALYARRRGFVDGSPWVVEFKDYSLADGMQIARTRTHFRVRDKLALDSERDDPIRLARSGFSPPGEKGEESAPTWAFREEVAGVVFLTREEADARYTLPPEAPTEVPREESGFR